MTPNPAADFSRDMRDLPLVNGLDQELQILERGRRHDPVPEVEDVTWPSAGRFSQLDMATACVAVSLLEPSMIRFAAVFTPARIDSELVT